MAEPSPGALSPLARRIIDAGTYDRLVVAEGTPPAARNLMAGVSAAQLLAVPVRSAPAASAMLAGLWLWHDALHECHEIAQHASDTLNFWHAIMHRREGDFSNAKYWYARCSGHPASDEIARWAKPVAEGLTSSLAARLTRAGWNPSAFVDWVEELTSRPDPTSEKTAVKLQQIEWQALFDHCAAKAAG